jgi:hypothetical protein
VASAERVATLELRLTAAAEAARARHLLQTIATTSQLRAGLLGLLDICLAAYAPELAASA